MSLAPRRWYAAVRFVLLMWWARRRIAVTTRGDLERLGSAYGGWIVPAGLLNEKSICWCAGVGEDATFDFCLIQRFGCDVFSLDPTPRAQEYIDGLGQRDRRHHFLPVGLWTGDVMLRFYAPEDPRNVSHSIVNLQKTTQYIEAPCRSLPSLLSEFAQSHVDLLKMDIEGAEHDVINNLLESKCLPTIMLVEFDQPIPWRRIKSTTRMLLHAGYKVAGIDGWNYTFVRS